MVYKHPKNTTLDSYVVWSGTSNIGNSLDKINQSEYFNALLVNNFFSLFVEARFEIIASNVMQKYIKFNTKGSDKYTWFSNSNIISSSWTDIQNISKNYFSIAGDTTNKRQWFVNYTYGGCDIDSGWIVVSTNPSKDACSQNGYWQNAPVGSILYSAGTSYVNYTSTAKFADNIVIMLR